MEYETLFQCYLELATRGLYWMDAVQLIEREIDSCGVLSFSEVIAIRNAIDVNKENPEKIASEIHEILSRYDGFNELVAKHVISRIQGII